MLGLGYFERGHNKEENGIKIQQEGVPCNFNLRDLVVRKDNI